MLIVAPGMRAYHFDGVAQALAESGLSACSETMQIGQTIHLTPMMLQQASVIVHADGVGINAVMVHGKPIEPSQPIVLQMDGVLEYANTFLNAHAGERFLQPSHANLVLASGQHDRDILRALGNRAVATGLPRLDGFVDRVRRQAMRSCHGILVASANQPAFTPGARSRLMASFRRVKAYATKQNLSIRWRIESEMACELGIENDETDLDELLAKVRCVLTSASTLAIESMMANKPTAILHPHPWDLWIPCAWRYDGDALDGIEEDQAAMNALQGKDHRANVVASNSIAKICAQTIPMTTKSIPELFDALMTPCAELMALQERIVEHYTCTDSARRVARVIGRVVSSNTGCRKSSKISAHAIEPNSRIIETFDAIRKAQSSRVTIIASRAPSLELATLVEHRFAEIERFIVLGEPDGASFLGVGALSFSQIQELGILDQSLLIVPQGDCALVVALQTLGVSVFHSCVYSDCELMLHIDEVMKNIREASLRGEVRTTLKETFIEGAEQYSSAQILRGNRPAMIVLQGEEIDFDLYQRSHGWRDQGTIVRSLGWSDAELSSPEYFGSLVRSFGDQSYAIYGGGLHTRRLLRYSGLIHRPCMILDDQVSRGDGKMLDGIPVVHPQDIRTNEVNFLVLSSFVHEESLWKRAACFRQMGMGVYRLYGSSGKIESSLGKPRSGV